MAPSDFCTIVDTNLGEIIQDKPVAGQPIYSVVLNVKAAHLSKQKADEVWRVTCELWDYVESKAHGKQNYWEHGEQEKSYGFAGVTDRNAPLDIVFAMQDALCNHCKDPYVDVVTNVEVRKFRKC